MRASLADSAAEFPLMPTRTKKQYSFSSLVNSKCSSKIFATMGWSYLTLSIIWKDKKESDMIRKYCRVKPQCEMQNKTTM